MDIEIVSKGARYMMKYEEPIMTIMTFEEEQVVTITATSNGLGGESDYDDWLTSDNANQI